MPRLQRDGVNLSYEEAGRGAPPLVFLHGGACDATHFAAQMEHFRRRHRCVAIDFRGHGQSDAPRQEYTVPGFVDDVLWLCTELGIHAPVLVGHSMGGVVALAFAAKHPDRVQGVVVLDAPVAVDPAAAAALIPRLLAGLQSPAYLDVLRGFMAANMLPTDDASRKQAILDKMSAFPQHVAQSVFERTFSYDLAPDIEACKVPGLFVSAVVPNDMTRLRQILPHFLFGGAAGVGHFLQSEAPDQVNAMIERFLAVGLPRAS